MARRRRLNYTSELKAEIWDKYEGVASLWSITRSIDSPSSSIYRLLAPSRASARLLGRVRGDPCHWWSGRVSNGLVASLLDRVDRNRAGPLRFDDQPGDCS